MTSITPTDLPNMKPNSGCSTFEMNQKMMDDTYAALKKAEQTIDKFIKTEEGIAKKESLKKNLAIGFLGAVGLATTGVALVKSGKINKLVDMIKDSKLAANIKDLKGKNEIAQAAKKEAKEIADAIKKITNHETISNEEFKLLTKTGNIETNDWIGGFGNFSGKVACKNKGEEILKTYKKGYLKELSVMDSDGKLVKKISYEHPKIGGPEYMYKWQNRTIENADGTITKKTIGNIELGDYLYFKATDGVVSPTLYTDSKCQKAYQGNATDLIKNLQEYFDKQNAIQ